MWDSFTRSQVFPVMLDKLNSATTQARHRARRRSLPAADVGQAAAEAAAAAGVDGGGMYSMNANHAVGRTPSGFRKSQSIKIPRGLVMAG